MRKLTYYAAATLDGYIAAPDGDFGFFDPYIPGTLPFLTGEMGDALPTPARAAFGLADAPNERFDTVLMGRASYEPGLAAGLSSPYAHLRQIVVSRSLTSSPDPAVEVTAEEPLDLVRRLKQEEGLGIYLCGGGDLAGQLLPEIDELIVKLNPVAVGSGIPLFRAGFSPNAFTLVDTRVLANGVLVLTYAKASGVPATAAG
ncbi:dihydrofolate reductase family protein [Kitasatospora sp. NBC_01246]|uniref:dihydrofolate reductase family protein n=1 Tax=Kitasatospora sp. NBC_01246 TaxID=2903570 RepID=UPI002E2F1A8B|nr:dihydrofolate reductase family protein [Kitasatospora sp. NBC_01246]